MPATSRAGLALVPVIALALAACTATEDPNPSGTPDASATAEVPQKVDPAVADAQGALAVDASAVYDLLDLTDLDTITPIAVGGDVARVGAQEVQLSSSTVVFSGYTYDGDSLCLEANDVLIGAVSSYADEAFRGQTCAEAFPGAVPFDIPSENYPGLNSWWNLLPQAGTCLDLRNVVVGGETYKGTPFVVDCDKKHEYVLQIVDDLDLGDAPSAKKIKSAASKLCKKAVTKWDDNHPKVDVRGWYYTYPYDWAYVEGQRSVDCLAQVAKDKKQTVNFDE